ncbi:GDSL-type esterase/lipase family protein [Ideonella sp.]|uniref:GDSL-type esterase/lipase family protein n=1 Tax=Ideonella sp. TaxID=1929293 RepID=UPI003BB64979
MNLLRSSSATLWTALVLFQAPTSHAQAPASPPAQVLHAGQPMAGWQWRVTDFEGERLLDAPAITVPKPAQPRVPASVVQARRSGKDAADDAITLQFKDSWIAQLRLEPVKAATLDLREALRQGTLEFDLNIRELAQAGLKFKLGCGPDCERKVPYLALGRAAAGTGWRHVSLSLACFDRDGSDFSRVGLPFALEATGTGELAIANLRIVPQGQANTACPDYRTESVTPTPLMESWSMEWWLPRHEKKLAEIRAHREAGREVQVVFIGDSITQGWENEGRAAFERHFARYNAVALGFGGDHTENVLWRLQHGEIDGMAPKVAVLMIGTNNTGDRQEDPATTVAGIRRLIEEIAQRQPATRVLLLAIYPREEKPGVLRALNERINTQLAGLADQRRVFFLNLNRQLMQADGRLSADVMPDWLHLSEKGYDIVARSLTPTLEKLLQP